MQLKATIQLLICGEPGSDTEYFVNLLRSSGYSARVHRVSSLSELTECLVDRNWELLITTENPPNFTAQDAIEVAERARIPSLVCAIKISEEHTEQLLTAGASDVFLRGQGDRLRRAIVREVYAQRCRRKLEELQPRYEETARRFEQLLETAQESVAYITDGVHINSSNAYARIFGYEKAEDLDGIPQVDLIAPSHQDEFKEALRDYRNQPDTRISIETTAQRADGSVFPARLVMTSATYEDEACIQVQVIADAPPETASPAAIKASYSAPHSAPVSASSDKKEVVKIEKASKQYVLGEQEIYALKDVSLNVLEGEFLALAGPSGSGKSTLLNLIGCIDTPDKGKVWIAGHNVEDRSPDQLSHLRAETIGFIFQTFNLLPVLSAWENVEYPLLQSKKFSKAQRKERVGHFLELVGLGKQMRNRPNELSGGQRQRVAIARALATDPSIVLADEPTANLDHKTGEGILELMQSINQEHGTTFVFSTHDSKVMEMAGRVVMLCDGEIEYERHWMESRAT